MKKGGRSAGKAFLYTLTAVDLLITVTLFYLAPYFIKIFGGTQTENELSIKTHFAFMEIADEIEERTVTWTDNNNKTWSVNIDVPLDIYNDCRTNGYLKYHGKTPYAFDYKKYMVDDRDAGPIGQIAAQVKAFAEEENYNDIDTIYMYISMIQSLRYESDRDYCGCEDMPKMPIITLFDGAGDCEDLSLALNALLKATGYDSVLVEFENHMMCAVACDYYGTYFTLNGSNKKYFFVETTSSGWAIGELSKKYNESFTIYYC